MDLGLAGRTALVTGASRGIGRGIAEALAREGARIVMAARSAERLEEAAAAIRAATGTRVEAMPVDLADHATVDRLAERAQAEIGPIDILVNNSGGPPPGPISEVGLEDWRRHFETMVLSLIRLTGRLLPGMRERRWGRILTVTSGGVVQPIPTLGISNTLRLALVGWSKTLSLEVAADGVTVNCLAPGRIDTERLAQLDRARAERQGIGLEEARARSEAEMPMRRYGTPEEFAAVAAFLASDRATLLTGSVIRIDGGSIAVY
jgi:3-oxoacyl-[acyl-carrier protein] reductase